MNVHVGCKNRSIVRVSILRGRDVLFGDARDHRPRLQSRYMRVFDHDAAYIPY